MVISIFCVLFHQLTSNWLLFWLVYFCVAVVLSIGKCGSGLFPTREIVFTESFFFTTKILCFFSVDFWLLFFVVVIKLIRKSGKFLTCASTQHCLRLCAFYLLDETQISGFHPIALVLNYAYLYIFFCPTPIQEQHFVQSWL